MINAKRTRVNLAALLLLACLLVSLACRPQPRLGDGPPQLDEHTAVLPAFDPAALAGPAATGLDLDGALAGPPQPPKPAPLPDPAVVDYGPTSEASDYPTVQIRFNRPMVPLGEKQRISAKQAGFEITPAIEGQAYWAEPTRLVFEPKSSLALAQTYVVKFQRRVAAVDGPSLDVDLEWSFGTEPPRVDMHADYGDQMSRSGGYHWKASVSVETTQDVSLGELRRRLSVTARDASGDAHPVDVAVRELKHKRSSYDDSPHFEITPATRWPAASEIVLTVDAALTGKAGPRPMGYPYTYSFETSAGVESLGPTCVEGEYDDGCELGPITVEFTAPITRAQAKLLRVSPMPKGLDVLAVNRSWDDQERGRNAYRGVMLWGDFQRGVPYEITIDERLRDVHGQPLIGSTSHELTFVEPPPTLALERQWGTFTGARGAKVGVESRHVDKLRVRVAALDDAQYERYRELDLQRDGWPSELDKPRVDIVTLSHTGKWGWSSHELDLSKYSGGGSAALLVEVSVDSLLSRARGRAVPRSQRGLVQITDLGVSAVGSLPGGVVRVARLSDDRPVVGAEIELIDSPGGTRQIVGKTTADGLLKLPSSAELSRDALLRVHTRHDGVLVDVGGLWPGTSPEGPLRHREHVQAAVMTERALYKPGERVRVMGWAAIATPYELASLRQLPPKTRVKLELRDHRNEVVATRTVRAKDHGKFWATLDIPEAAALGDYSLSADLLGHSFRAGLAVKDFPAPEFEVTAAASRTDIHGGESSEISVDASYYFGGRVPIQRGRYVNECSEIDFRPPGMAADWQVGPRRAHYLGYGRMGNPSRGVALGPKAEAGHLDYTTSPGRRALPQTLQCKHSVAVGDATEREVGAEATIWVHPDFYLGARAPSSLEHGETARVELATIDFDGSPVSVKDVEVTLTRSWSEPEYVKEDGKRRFAGWRARSKQLKPCRTKTPATSGEDGAQAVCEFTKLEQGSYTIVVTAKHGDYAPVVDDWLWVRAPHNQAWPRVKVDHLIVSVNQSTPRPGDTIRARVEAPWKSGAGLMMLAKGGMHDLRTFDLVDGSAELEFAVTDGWIPGAQLHVLAIEPGDSARDPQLRSAQTEVSVASDSRQLSVRVEVPAEAQTRARVPIEITVRDAAGDPTRGHVSVWAVDEAVLALAPLELPDFVAKFVVGFWPGLSFADSYGALMLPYTARADDYRPRRFDPGWANGGGWGFMGVGSGAGGGGYGAGGLGLGGIGGAAMPSTRSEFSSAPIFIGDAELDAHGVAKLEGELPDNLTTFRVTAVASAPLASGVEARFGSGDARVRVTRPIVVRAALPRIMRPGDLAEVGVLVDNLRGGDGTLDVEVALLDADGVLELLSKPKASAKLGAGEQVRLPFTVRALSTGEPQFEVRATLRPTTSQGKPSGDALRLPLPVEPERTLTDRVAVYGTLADDGAALLPFLIPDDADPNFGGLSVSVGSTLLGGLEDAVAYLVHYPHGCLEQTSSSLLPLIPLGRLAKDYPLGIGDVDAYVDAGISRLRAMQLSSGGFAYWPGGTEPAPYASAYATWILGRAKAAGYRVPAAMLDHADAYLLGLVADWSQRAGPSQGEDIEVALMLSALAERGQAPAEALRLLYDRRAKLPIFSQAMLLLALEANASHAGGLPDPRVATLLGELKSLVDEREAVAKVETSSARWTWYWDSDVRSSAIVLMAMLRADPMHPLAPKLTRGLLESRRGGRWSNTQENAYALVALADYAAIYEAEAPNFDGRVWLGNSMLASVHVEGREFGFEDGFTAMDALLDAGARATSGAHDNLILERAGQGRMYYRVGLEWASTASDKPAKAEGIHIERTLRSEAGVIGEDQAVSSGDLLAIDVEIEIPAALDHVAIEIPLPAGIEAVDLDLGKGTAAMKLAGNRGYWVSHQELRRDRAVLFADHIAPGKYLTTVFLRATTPGEYVMPAGHAEMMYYPEVYGRTTARRLLVR